MYSTLLWKVSISSTESCCLFRMMAFWRETKLWETERCAVVVL
ncbi:hypothetical protein OIU77_016869 [Salix suchowensis]|uniref:Uncharacterized protein n=1 Tax=Salix suchowensis TaxID=1278906 RepID=A0ABQ8ZMA9_9ROSI|nr:hypothetical protein OIU77_016869 [Salix suchowensis]